MHFVVYKINFVCDSDEMLDMPISSIMLKSLYEIRPDHYRSLNYSEWLFAMKRVEKALAETNKSFYLTEIGVQYFERTW